MCTQFIQHFNSKVPLTESEQEFLQSHLVYKKYRRKQYLLHAGDICQSFAFIEKGAMKSYTLDEQGVEHIIQFGVEGWIISDLYSFLTGEPATYNIDAVEDTEVTLISKNAHDRLLLTMPKYETYTRLNFEGAYIAMQRRLTSMISLSLEERYEKFRIEYPTLLQRFPQHMIASYMGLTPETLSRIRKRIADK